LRQFLLSKALPVVEILKLNWWYQRKRIRPGCLKGAGVEFLLSV